MEKTVEFSKSCQVFERGHILLCLASSFYQYYQFIYTWSKGYCDKPVTVVAGSFTHDKALRQSQKIEKSSEHNQRRTKMLEVNAIRPNFKCGLKSHAANCNRTNDVKNIDTYRKILKKSGEYFIKIFSHSKRKFRDIFASIFGKTCEKLS